MKLYIKSNITSVESKFKPNSFFFNNDWLQLISRTFGYKIKYLISEDQNNKFVIPFCETKLFFKKYLISLPFSFNNNLDHRIENSIISNTKYLNEIFKNSSDVIIKSKFLNHKKNYHLKTKYNFYYLELNINYEKKFSKNITKNFNKKVDYQIVKNIDSKEFRNFFTNYVLNAKQMGTFFYTEKFLQNIFHLMDDNFFLINSYLNNNYLGGQIILLDKKNSQGIYFISSKSNLGKKLSIDKILLRKSMSICFDRKLKFFNLGKVNISNKGLNDFKSQFGAKKIELNYFSLKKKNYGILDQKSFNKIFIQFVIKFLPIKFYILINNKFFKSLGMY